MLADCPTALSLEGRVHCPRPQLRRRMTTRFPHKANSDEHMEDDEEETPHDSEVC